MSFRKRVPDEFGLILPRDNDTYWVKQIGGMTPTQAELEGLYIPLGRPTHHLGYPEWKPENNPEVDLNRQFQEQNLKEELSDEEFKKLPNKVQRRGNFEGWDEFSSWVDESEEYGQVDLYKDLYRFTYGLFDLLESDPRNRWESVDELWDVIDDSFSFTYETIDTPYRKEKAEGEVAELMNDYPRSTSPVRWVRITGSKTYDGRVEAEWAEEHKGEIAFLMCPNAD